jgi:phosphoglycerate kinase
LPSYAGFLIEKEIEHLSQALRPPEGSVAVIGGAKFETKLPLLTKLLSLYGTVLLGGALGNDMLKARGMPFGASLISTAPVPLEIAGDERIRMMADAVVLGSDGKGREALVNDIRADEKIVDIGPATALAWSELVGAAPFVLWNGPMGVYEEGYTKGTDTLAKTLVERRIPAVIGGGDTEAALRKFSFDPARVFVSTGGGAMLEFLASGTLPGLEPLKK